MYSKILISGEMELLTGMHIGTGGEYAPIGAADSPVLRDLLTNMPIVPGSTIKGKMRTLLAKKYNSGRTSTPADDDIKIKRIFGYSADGKKSRPSRAIFSDAQISNLDELRALNVEDVTEIKFENTINRLSGVANPRQIERVIRGAKFNVSFVYDIQDEWADEVREDLNLLCEGLKLLKYDYIGGHGTRGYGRVGFNDFSAEVVVGSVDDSLISEINAFLKEV